MRLSSVLGALAGNLCKQAALKKGPTGSTSYSVGGSNKLPTSKATTAFNGLELPMITDPAGEAMSGEGGYGRPARRQWQGY